MSDQESPGTAITVKQALNSTLNYIQEFSSVMPNQSSLRLEETEFDDRRNEWRITISFNVSPLAIAEHRIQKLFRVDAEKGSVKSMTSRTP
jgi:hypothetical protein